MCLRTSLRALLLGVGCLVTAVACGESGGDGGGPAGAKGAPVGAKASALGAAVDQSFQVPETWTSVFATVPAWRHENLRLLADIDGNGKKDMVGFANDAVWLGMSTGSGFTTFKSIFGLGADGGWSVAKHPRMAGDINGDGLDDIVAFGGDGIWVATSNGAGLNEAGYVLNEFGYGKGWRTEVHERTLADINGDGCKDVVGFGNDGVWVSLGSPWGLGPASYVLAGFGADQGWTNARHVRTLGDINGDGSDDIVAFGDDGVWVALANGAGGFGAATFVHAGLGYYTGSWRVDRNPRVLADVDNDGKKDIVAFGDDGVWVARSAGPWFESPLFVLAAFEANHGWTVESHLREVVDLNGDGYLDIVGYGDEAIYRSLGGPAGFSPVRMMLRDLTPQYGFPGSSLKPQFFGDVDGDGMTDVVAIGYNEVKVSRSSSNPPPEPPKAPSKLAIAGSTSSAVSLTWQDNSNDERNFYINFGKGSSLTGTAKRGANETSTTIGSLDDDTNYCFSVQAESLWGVSVGTPLECGKTQKESGGGGGGGGEPPHTPVTKCGVGLTCPAGYHPIGYTHSGDCEGVTIDDNATICAFNEGFSFSSCGIINCPAGWHAVSFDWNPSCIPSYATPTINDNASTCVPDSPDFNTCGKCPPGYLEDSAGDSGRCEPYDVKHCTKK